MTAGRAPDEECAETMSPKQNGDRLQVGVVGLGMGRHHVAGYQNHPGAEVVAIADLDPARLAQIGDQYGIPGRYSTA